MGHWIGSWLTYTASCTFNRKANEAFIDFLRQFAKRNVAQYKFARYQEKENDVSTNKSTTNVRKSLGDFAPKLVGLTEDVLFGDVWERPELSKRDRSLITCAALIATGKTEQMGFHFPNAIKNGVTQVELVEMITHLAFYVGWPSAMSAATRAKELVTKEPS